MKRIARRVIAIFLFLFYVIYIHIPLFISDFKGHEERRTYFSVVAVFAGSLTSIFGLGLGFFYYFDKLENDRSEKDRENRKNQIDYILSQLKLFDEQVNYVIDKSPESEDELFIRRGKILRGFDEIYMLLGLEDILNKFGIESVNEIIEVNSFVNNNEAVMELKFDHYKKYDFSEIREEYFDKIRLSKKICFSRMAS